MFFFLAYSFVSYQRKGDKTCGWCCQTYSTWVRCLRGFYSADSVGQGCQALFLERVGIASCCAEVTTPNEPITTGLANVFAFCLFSLVVLVFLSFLESFSWCCCRSGWLHLSSLSSVVYPPLYHSGPESPTGACSFSITFEGVILNSIEYTHVPAPAQIIWWRMDFKIQVMVNCKLRIE